MIPVKKIRCIKCDYFDSVPDCNHCRKCLQVELTDMLLGANVEILKIVSQKKLLREIN